MNSTDSKTTKSGTGTQAVVPDQEIQASRAKKHRKGHIYRRGNVFWLAYKVNGKRFRQSLGTSDIKEARAERARIMAPFSLATEEEVLQTVKQRIETTSEKQESLATANLPQVVIGNAWDTFVRSRNRPDPGPTTLHQYELQYRRFAEWVSTHHPEIVELRDVGSTTAEEYADALAASDISANTFNKHIRLLMLVFRVLKKRARLRDNPWEDIQRRKEDHNSRRELTSEELQKVVGSTKGELHTLFALGIYTGLRLGDCATLRWSEVDLNRGIIIRVPRKTGRGRAKPVHVPIHPTLAGVLADVRNTSSLPAKSSRGKRSKRKVEDPPEKYVLPTTASRYLTRTDLVTDQIQSHFRKCGIRTQKPGTGKKRVQKKGVKYKSVGKRAVVEVGFHSLRHTFVSLCREANAPLAVVESIVGHSNPAMTRHYTHVGDAAATQAVASIPSLTGKPGKEATEGRGKASTVDRDRKMKTILKASKKATWERDRDKLLALLSDSN